MAPIMTGHSHCPAQCGRTTGLLSEPAAGLLLAQRVPKGQPRDPRSVLPRLDTGHRAIDLVAAPKRVPVHSLGGDLGGKDAEVRHALHARGLRTVGMPTTVAPITPTPSQQAGLDLLNASGCQRLRTPHHVHWACVSGSSRPGVESHLATLMSHGAAHVRSKGLEGAVVQMGLTVMAHHGAVLVRIRQQRLAKRGQTFRRLLGLKR